jgi:hypothetical protein
MTHAVPPTDPTLMPLGARIAADLTRRAAAAELPRAYVHVGDAMQAALAEWLEEHGRGLDDEQRARWLRWFELLDNATVELLLVPGRLDALVLTVDSPVELTMRELHDLTPETERDDVQSDAEPRNVMPGPVVVDDGSGTGGRTDRTRELLRQRRKVSRPPP